MIDQQTERGSRNRPWTPDAPVPAARALTDFCSERVGDDIVIYDPESIRYHTLNPMAYDVWRSCDGQRTVDGIAGAVAPLHPETHVESVALAVEELGEAGLLEVPGERFDARIQRRAVLKLAAAGVIGAVGLPVVASITAPSASAQASGCVECGGPPGCLNNNATCASSCACKGGCCCRNVNNGNQDCRPGPNQCDGANEVCL